MSVLRGNNGPRYKHNADETAPYDVITVDKLTPIIGAEIGGVDLSQPLGNQTFQEIHRALAENLVIFFRDQHITDEQHLEFGRSFGKLHIHPAAPHEPGHPELMIIHAERIHRAPTAKAGTATYRATRSLRWAASSISAPARRAAETRCSPRCTPHTKRCPTA